MPAGSRVAGSTAGRTRMVEENILAAPLNTSWLKLRGGQHGGVGGGRYTWVQLGGE